MSDPQDKPGGKSEILIYQSEDGKSRIQVRLEDETVWLTQALMGELFQTSIPNISMHIRNLFQEGELDAKSVVKSYLTTAADGKKYSVSFYNLDAILSVGYRVRSHRGTQFRKWATERLREYLVKGFTMDDERLKEGRTRLILNRTHPRAYVPRSRNAIPIEDPARLARIAYPAREDEFRLSPI